MRVFVGVTVGVLVLVGVTVGVRVIVRVIVGVGVIVLVLVAVIVIVLVGVAVSDTDEPRFIRNSPANRSPLKRFILQIHMMNSLYGLDLYCIKIKDTCKR